MFSCLKPSFSLKKQILISNRNYFSVLSRKSVKLSGNYGTNKAAFKNRTSHIQFKCLSAQSINSFYQGIYTSEPALFTTNMLIEMHDFLNIPWSTTILASSVLMKTLIGFPCALYQRYLIARLEQTQIELKEKAVDLKKKFFEKAARGQWTKEKLQKEIKKEVRNEWRTLVVRNNCHPFKILLLFLIQFPFWLFLSVAIRTLVDAHFNKNEYPVEALQFQKDGPFWSPNLLLPDPTFILPVLNFLSMLLLTEIVFFSKTFKNNSKGFVSFLTNKFIPNFMRLFAVVFLFISSVSPSALSLFWSSSSLFALAQGLLLMSPRVRRFLKIPKVPSEVDKPYRFAFNNFIDKLYKFFLRKK